MKRIALYARVSTRDQSVEPQLDALRSCAEARGLDVIEEYVDKGISGAKDWRPYLNKLIRDGRGPVGAGPGPSEGRFGFGAGAGCPPSCNEGEPHDPPGDTTPGYNVTADGDSFVGVVTVK